MTLISSFQFSNSWWPADEEKDELDDTLDDIQLHDSGNEISPSHTDQCPVCLMSLKEQLLGTPNNCPHVFCFECIQEWAKVRNPFVLVVTSKEADLIANCCNEECFL